MVFLVPKITVLCSPKQPDSVSWSGHTDQPRKASLESGRGGSAVTHQIPIGMHGVTSRSTEAERPNFVW